jgi:hypothetical protein
MLQPVLTVAPMRPGTIAIGTGSYIVIATARTN